MEGALKPVAAFRITWGLAGVEGDAGYMDVPAKDGREFVIEGLAPFSEYAVKVAAGSLEGFGPPSAPVTARTLEDGKLDWTRPRRMLWMD